MQNQNQEKSIIQNILVSVYDKKNIVETLSNLTNINVISTGGTAKLLSENFINVTSVENYTQFSEILGGRVKTLHPKIFGGILHLPEYEEEIEKNQISPISTVIVNLYPFEKVIEEDNENISKCIENIDIGGVSLIRAAAKNYKYVSVLTDPSQYIEFLQRYPDNITLEYRKELAIKAFEKTSQYDTIINKWFLKDSESQRKTRNYEIQYNLKYGCNPHQKNTKILRNLDSDIDFPFKILNGNPGYINILDAINSWYLVSEVNESLDKECAASFKHVSPAGVSISDNVLDAYIGARDCDPKSSFGDFIAISGKVNIELANFIKTKVSDGIIALDYEDEALEILKKKKNGNFIILKGNQIDLKETHIEYREIKGLVISQDTNNHIYTMSDLENIVTKNIEINKSNKEDLILGNITLKYTQSNSVCFVHEGKTIGIGAGQQSRIDCVKIARKKAEIYLLRNSPLVLKLPFKVGIKYQDKINAQIQYIENDMSELEYHRWLDLFEYIPEFIDDKRIHLQRFTDISLISDAFFPFRDSIDTSSMIGVKHVSQPGGSVADEGVIEACNEYGMVMSFTGIRSFHH